MDLLSGTDKYTLFAPTDAAFEELLDRLEVTDPCELAPQPLLTVLQYHVVDGRRFSNSVFNRNSSKVIETLAGEDIVSFVDEVDGPTLHDVDGQMVGVVDGMININAINGVIVLNGLRDRLVAESAARERLLPLLETEVAELARCARSPELGERYVETVLQINRLLNRATPNRRLSAYLTSLEQQTARYSRLGLSTPERRRQSVQRWQRLVKAIRAGDGAAAEQIARERVLESRDAAIRLLAARAEYGEEKRGRS